MSYSIKGDVTRRKIYTPKTRRQFAADAYEIFTTRAFVEGRDANDAAFPPYSQRPSWVSDSDDPTPRGGRKTLKGRSYSGGYRQYKRATFSTSKRRPFKTGLLRRSVRGRLMASGAVIIYVKAAGHAHARAITKRARWFALSPKDRLAIIARFRVLLRKEAK